MANSTEETAHMNTTGNLNSKFWDSSKQPKTEPRRFKPASIDSVKPDSVSKQLSLKLKSARLYWIQAKAIVRLANQGHVNKSQAFRHMNAARTQYKQAMRLTEAYLESLG